MSTAPLPAAFFGHGSPMNALEHNRYTESWTRFGESVERPRAILAISAHWYINATAVTAMERPRTIHDFFGFPPELFALQYPAPGAPELAAEIMEAAAPVWVGADNDSWGLDHGTWSVLVHAFPAADIPVVQLAIDATKPPSYHYDLGARLAPLRERGVLIVASGNIVHNLRRLDPAKADEGFDWAERFDTEVRRILTQDDPKRVVDLHNDRDYELAVPTADHWLPAVYFAGVVGATGSHAEVLVDGYAMGSLSMTSLTVS
jgi:4,5-DOPA dioxygenase extradiol